MSAAQGSPPPGGDVDLGPSMMAIYLTLSILALICVIGRLYIRYRHRNFGADDYTMFISAIIFLGLGIVTSIAAVDKTFRHVYYMTDEQTTLALLINVIVQTLVTVSEAFGKCSIALLLLRIISGAEKKSRMFLWALIWATSIIALIGSLFPWFQCHDSQAVWDLSQRQYTTCWAGSIVANEAVWCSSYYTALDFILALFPALIISKLQLSTRRKVGVCALLGLGVITGVICLVKTAQLPSLAKNTTDAVFDQYELQILTAVEIFLMIVLGCAPVYKGPWDLFMKASFWTKLPMPLGNIFPRTTTSKRSRSRGPHGEHSYRNFTFQKPEEMAFPLQSNLDERNLTEVRVVSKRELMEAEAEAESNGSIQADDQSSNDPEAIHVIRTFQVV